MQPESTPHSEQEWEAEIKAMSDRLARESRRSGILGFLGGVVVMGGIGLMVLATVNAKKQLTTEVTANKSLTTEVHTKEAQVTTAQKQAKAVTSVLGATVENLQSSQNSGVSAALEKAIDADPAAAALIPRVYIHVHLAEQRPQATAIAAALRQAGYIVPGIDIKQEVVRQTEVHYYSDDAQSLSDTDAIVKAVASTGIPVRKRQVPAAATDKLRPRADGLWVAPGQAG